MDDIELPIADLFGAKARGQKFAVYVPNQDRDGQAVNQALWVTRALTLFSEYFGGATAIPYLKGAWLNPESRKLIVEEPQLVYSYVDGEAFVAHAAALERFLREMGEQTNQGQIGFEFDGVFYLMYI